MTTTSPVAALLDLGFTEIEAKLFVELTRLGPSTGYRLGKAIGKAAANTYQALETLAQKGAVLVDEADDAKTWRAIPAPSWSPRWRRATPRRAGRRSRRWPAWRPPRPRRGSTPSRPPTRRSPAPAP